MVDENKKAAIKCYKRILKAKPVNDDTYVACLNLGYVYMNSWFLKNLKAK